MLPKTIDVVGGEVRRELQELIGEYEASCCAEAVCACVCERVCV